MALKLGSHLNSKSMAASYDSEGVKSQPLKPRGVYDGPQLSKPEISLRKEENPQNTNGAEERTRVIKTVCSIHAPRPRLRFTWDSSIKKAPKKKSRTPSDPKSRSSSPVSGRKLKHAEEPIIASAEVRNAALESDVEKSSNKEPTAPEVKTTSPLPPKTKSAAPSAPKINSTPPMSGRKRGNAIVREEPRDASIEARSIAREAARAHQTSLASGTPSVVISMVPSHVYRVFWLNLPRRFCDGNLPENKSKLTLEDEEGNEFTVVFIPERYGLSGGWVSFAREKKLHDGDAVVLEQIEKTRLKVHIFRSTELFPNVQAESARSLEKKKKQQQI